MGVFDRVRRWREERARAAEQFAHELAERRATLDTLTLAQADRALALIIGKPAILPYQGAARANGLDAYTAAFGAANEGVCFAGSDGHGPWVSNPEDEAARSGLFIVALDEVDEAYGTRPGSTELFSTEPREPESVAASIAHFGLEAMLDDEELEELAGAPDTWTPDPEIRPVGPAPDPRFMLRPAFGVADAVVPVAVIVAALGFLVFASVTIDRDLAEAALAAGGLTLLLVPWNLRILLERARLEPIARGLDIGLTGINDVTTGKRVAWSEMRAVEVRSRIVRVTLPSGQRVDLPKTLWFDPKPAVDWIVKEAAKREKGAYR